MSKHKKPLTHEQETRKISKWSLRVAVVGGILSIVSTLNSCSQSRTASETLQLTQVAYVGFARINIVPAHGNWSAGGIGTFTNGGNTPALKFKANLHKYVVDSNVKLSGNVLEDGRATQFSNETIIQAKSSKNVGYVKISYSDYDNAINGKSTIFFYGNFQFNNVVNQHHYGEYCVFTTGVTENFATGEKTLITAECPFHNCLDDDCPR